MRRASARVHLAGTLVPDDFHRLHRFVTLTADVMFVSGVSFFVTLSRRIKLYTAEHTPNCTRPVLANSLKKILNVYTQEVDMW